MVSKGNQKESRRLRVPLIPSTMGTKDAFLMWVSDPMRSFGFSSWCLKHLKCGCSSRGPGGFLQMLAPPFAEYVFSFVFLCFAREAITAGHVNPHIFPRRRLMEMEVYLGGCQFQFELFPRCSAHSKLQAPLLAWTHFVVSLSFQMDSLPAILSGFWLLV